MKVVGRVSQIFITAQAGEPMIEVPSVRAIGGVGLEGDRYASGKGAFSKKREVIRHASLISMAAIRDANALLDHSYFPSETRRNLILAGISASDLNRLARERFFIGGVSVRGVELCTPCVRPAKLAKKPNTNSFAFAFHECGGIRIEILNDGLIAVGTELIILE